MGLVSLITFIPLVGAVFIIFLPKREETLIKSVAVAATFIPLMISIQMLMQYDSSIPGIMREVEMQFVEHFQWIPAFNIEYFVGVDGLSMPMVFLTALLSFISIIASWNINKQIKGYFSLFLLLETGMMGVFVALDFFLFYIFWEVMLLPMFFLIGIWGAPRREYAAIKFFLYTLFGSVLMLLGMLALYFTSDPRTFNMMTLIQQGGHTILFQQIVFLAFFIGFAIKVPIFPFHTWLPDAHVEAPTAVSVILAGVLLKMGTYGLLRISFPMLPEAALYFAYPMAILGLINILYGAFVAMAQKDLKKLVAYSSVSHMGYVLLGMAVFTPAGMTGAVMQMFNHGTITAMLFLLVGVIYDRAHHRDIEGFGGLWTRMPIFTAFSALAFFAALGLPTMSSFISEVLVFLGAFQRYQTITILAAIGIVITAAYVLWTFKRVFLGKLNEKYADLPDMSGREIFTLVPLGAIVIALGIYPMPIIDLMNSSLTTLVKFVSQ